MTWTVPSLLCQQLIDIQSRLCISEKENGTIKSRRTGALYLSQFFVLCLANRQVVFRHCLVVAELRKLGSKFTFVTPKFAQVIGLWKMTFNFLINLFVIVRRLTALNQGGERPRWACLAFFLRSIGHCHIITNQCSFSNSMIFQITVYALCTFIDSNMNFEKNIMNMIFYKRKFSKNFLSALWIFKVMLLFWASLIRMNMTLVSEEDRWAQL